MKMTLFDYGQEVKRELFRILDYWIKYDVEKDGDGFYGVVNDKNEPDAHSPKAVVINSRILWTFSAAHRLFPDDRYLTMAKRAFAYLKKYFVDDKYGGVYWSVDHNGSPLETRKQLYGHSFAVFGLSEYYLASKDEEALKTATGIFSTMIKYAYDESKGGYIEAFKRDWS